MMPLAQLTAIAASLFLIAPADTDEKPGDKMIDGYLAQETAKINKRELDGAKTLAEWLARRPRLKQEYFDMLGLWPLPEKTPLHASITGTLERDNVVIEKLHFQSRPGLYVTGNLYRPKNVEGRLPGVLYVCGHSARGRDGNKAAFQDHGLWFGTNGYICLIIDTLQLGEIPGVHHGTYGIGHENYAIQRNPVEVRWWWQALGYTPAGVECWNGIRAIDYLVSRPDVDAERIAVTGISGGGAATFWISAADERVKCAVPVSGMSDLESYVSHKVINGHCDCMFLVNTYGWEWTTIAALVAPRPLLFCNSDQDPIFPMDGNRRIIARLRKLYAMYGKPELVDDYVSHGGHDYRPDLRIAIFKWINKHIKKDSSPVKDADSKPIPGKEMRVFPDDKDMPADVINGKIDETFVRRGHADLPRQADYESWKKLQLDLLRGYCFRAFPDRIPLAVGLGRIPLLGWVTASTEPEIIVWGDMRRRITPKDTAGWVLVTESPTEAAELEKMGFLGRDPCVVLPLRGTDRTDWTRRSPPNYVERSLALLGRTADEGRVWDIAALVRGLDEETKGRLKWKVAGRGQAGIIAAYAALLEPSISEVVVVDPPQSHRDGPIFLNVLRVLDVPDALGLVAPRRLTLINARDKAFDRTAAIYKAAGTNDKLERQ
jgi:cephalosporin-C deacetylase-like acetyl esterase